MTRRLFKPRRALQTRLQPEQQLHIGIAAFLRVALKPPTFWTTFPAGGGGRTRGAFLKAMGLKSGVPDLIVLHPAPLGESTGSIVLGIELKSKDGRLSDDQVDTHEAMTVANARVRVCRSVEEVADFLRSNGVPVWATIMAGGGFMVERAPALSAVEGRAA